MKERGSRVLVFSQMTRMLDILEDYSMWRGLLLFVCCSCLHTFGQPRARKSQALFTLLMDARE